MADWDGLRHDLERSVAAPPLTALRERRHRRRQRRAIAMTSLVLLGGTATGVAILGQAEQRRSQGPTASLDVVVNSEDLAPPKDYEDPVVTDVDFVTPNLGWAIGLKCVGDTCDISTWRTTDGGRTWGPPSSVARGVPRVTFKEESPAGGAVRSVRMVDEKNGFAFNPALYVTSDGGQTWQRQLQQSKATSVSVAGSTYWVTERGCPAGVDCDVVVRAGTVGAAELQPMAGLPETNGASAIVRRAGTDNGYLVAWGAPKTAFYATADGGETWDERVNPCPDATAQSLSAGAGRPLWLVCTTPAGRTAFQSADHGATWRPLAKPPADGIVTDLVARTATDAYLTTQQPARLFVTSDGGATWRRATGTGEGFGYGNLDVVDATHSWAMGDAGILWRTTDGHRWERLALPPGAPRVTATPSAAPPTTAAPDEVVAWTGMWFEDPSNGVVLGRACTTAKRCRALLRRTSDGGDTWQVAGAPPGTFEEGSVGSGFTSVVFSGRTGYLWGTHLWVTHDGGATWKLLDFAIVRQVVVAAGFVWVVEFDGCLGQECFTALRRAPLGSDTFTTLLDDNDVVPQQKIQLAVTDADHAYVYPADMRIQEGTTWSTEDGGKTWTSRVLPCPGALSRVVTPYDGGLWMMCGDEGGGGNQPHTTAHSTNGGRSWTDLKSTDGTGYLTSLVALSPTVAWRADSGIAASIKVTRDGGLTWQRVPAPDDIGGGGGPWAFQVFEDRRHGVGLFFDDVFVRMTDGRTWQAMPTPPAA